jgi:hypothetical protein
VHRAQVLSHLLDIVDAYPKAMSDPDNDNPANWEEQHNRRMLLCGLHQCLQSMRITALPLDQQILLLIRATAMPAMLADTDEADKMAVSLLEMMRTEGDNADWFNTPQGEKSLYDFIEHMLERLFARGSQQSIHRFGHLYQAMANLPQSIQTAMMQAILIRCANQPCRYWRDAGIDRCDRAGSPSLPARRAQTSIRSACHKPYARTTSQRCIIPASAGCKN